MKKLILIPLLALSACGYVAATPEAKYYQLNQLYTATLKVAAKFKEGCDPKPAEHPCHNAVEELKVAVKAADKAFDQADQVFVTKESEYYDLSLSVAENALNGIRKLLTDGATNG